jgi:hypothetical protein
MRETEGRIRITFARRYMAPQGDSCKGSGKGGKFVPIVAVVQACRAAGVPSWAGKTPSKMTTAAVANPMAKYTPNAASRLQSKTSRAARKLTQPKTPPSRIVIIAIGLILLFRLRI